MAEAEYKSEGKLTKDIDGLVQERYNSSANALELGLSCTTHQYAGV